MHLLEAGVNIIYIRDILEHVDVSTTEVARANMAMKQTALKKSPIFLAVNFPLGPQTLLCSTGWIPLINPCADSLCEVIFLSAPRWCCF